MTFVDKAAIGQAAARAALAVPGVAGLQPSLGQLLAGAAADVQQTVGLPALSPEAGVRTERTPRGEGWHVEVRCVLSMDRRALDTAREVRGRVRRAVTSHLARHGTSSPVTVIVTVTHLVG
jgi:hypothetical protein